MYEKINKKVFDMKEIIKKVLGFFMEIIPLKNKIVFESNPDMADNTYAFFRELVAQGYNKKYKCIWLVKDVKINQNKYKYDNVYFQEHKPRNIIGLLRRIWLLYTAKYLISSHSYVQRKRKKQVVIALGHGIPIKSVKKYFMVGKDCDFALCPSARLIDSFCKEFKLEKEHLFICGYPRNDMLFVKNEKLDKLINLDGKKVIMWLPTFRKHCDKTRTDSEFDFPLGIPIIYSEEELRYFNEVLIENNVLLLLKPHPAQDTSVIKMQNLSNFIIITDEMFNSVDAQLYEILACTDALITDYSSVYCDYLLLDKPIAITLDDCEEYSEKNGFAYENIKEILCGNQVYNIAQLRDFVLELSDGIDKHYYDRLKTKQFFNENTNGNYCRCLLEKLINEYGF